LYYEIYTGTKTANRLLINAIKPFVEKLIKTGVIKKWHFVRFNEPDFHIRLRFQFNQGYTPMDMVMSQFNEMIQSYVENHFVWKIELSTYNRELERYGGSMIENAESVFYRDSVMVVHLLEVLKVAGNLDKDWLVALKSIDTLYNLFGVNLKERHKHVSDLYQSFLIEFDADRSVKKQIETKFRVNREAIDSMIEIDGTSEFHRIIEERNRKIEKDIKLQKLNSMEEMRKYLTSFIHMHINRIMMSNPRMHELVIYGMLTKHYNSKIGKSKYVKLKEEVI